MKTQAIGWASVDIAPKKPVRQCGYIQQTKPVSKVKDSLTARICRLLDNNADVIWVNVDSIGFPIDRFHKLKNMINETYGHDIHVIVSATHTHFAGDPRDDDYFKQVCDAIIDSIAHIELQQGKLTYQRHYEKVDLIGKSRITNHEVITVLDVVTICRNEEPFMSLIGYNCHPTIMDGNTPFFSHEYPGVLLSMLKKKYPYQNFMFLQGADGDVSTRFSRNDQSYEEVVRLATILFEKVDDMITRNTTSKTLSLHYHENEIALEHQMKDFSDMSLDGKTSREIETIETGRIVQEKIKQTWDHLPKSLRYSSLSLGEFKYLFFPNELFSEYISYVDLAKCSVICYSQGYAPYVSGLKEIAISYELFTDTYTKKTKERLISTLQLESKGVT